MLLSANDLRQTGKNQFPVISGCKDTLPGSGYLSGRIGSKVFTKISPKFSYPTFSVPKISENFLIFKMSISTFNWVKFGIFKKNCKKNSLWNWRSLIKIPNKYDFIWSSWINIAGYNQSQVIYLETNPITNVKLTQLFCLTPTLEYPLENLNNRSPSRHPTFHPELLPFYDLFTPMIIHTSPGSTFISSLFDILSLIYYNNNSYV